MAVQPDTATQVRSLRARAGLSQRAFGELVGTSGPTVAAYEAGRREPRLSTLVRMAEAVGLDLLVVARDADEGARARRRRDRRRMALAAAAMAAAEEDWPAAVALARRNLGRMGSHPAVERWDELLDRGPGATRSAFLEEGPAGEDLRQMTPFAGLLTDPERRAALAAVQGGP